MCIDNNIKAFTMKNLPFSTPSLTAKSMVLVVALFTASAANAQCCNQGRFQRGGAFEMAAGATQLALNSSNLLPLQADLSWFARSRGPLRSGVRLGMAHLGTSTGTPLQQPLPDGAKQEDAKYRILMPGISGVLRLDPFRGGFRPFIEGEAGVDATYVDRRTFDGSGERQQYNVTTFDPALQYGWSAGARIRFGRSAFLVIRYGNKHGGSLNIPLAEGPESMFESADGERHTATLGLSFGL